VELVTGLFQNSSDIDLPFSEHVVGGENVLPVQPHFCVGVQSFKNEFVVFGRIQVLQVELQLIFPVFIFDPLHLFFMGAVEGIGYLVVPEEVQVYYARHFGREGFVGAGLLEGPVVVEWDLRGVGRS
jgi:hypothetical protein